MLASSSPNRALFEDRTADVDESAVEFETDVVHLRTNVIEYTRAICARMFQLFDYAEFGPSIYREIIEKFVDGVVT